ncbi:hypothetical protein C8R45DRAFT_937776 [Mycena sanguinolenta]|nr:hypothetical protein C8R45DRAFT_937776 [Mycena sanguinolenta]
MFALASYLYYHNKVTGTRILLYSTTAMFVLGTIQMALKVVIAVVLVRMVRLAVIGDSLGLVRNAFSHDRLVFVRYLLLTTSNAPSALTDSVFMYRCYVVWGRTISVLILPGALLAVTTGLGYFATYRNNYQLGSTAYPEIAFVMSVATNSTLTMLTAGRMWWVGREVGRASTFPGTTSRNYNTAVVMILESGALYSLCLIAYVVSGVFMNSSAIVINNILIGVLPQVVNIVPTLIAVRVGISRGVEARWIDRSTANLTFTSVRMRSAV